MTVVVVIHELNLAIRYADHLIVMKGGRDPGGRCTGRHRHRGADRDDVLACPAGSSTTPRPASRSSSRAYAADSCARHRSPDASTQEDPRAVRRSRRNRELLRAARRWRAGPAPARRLLLDRDLAGADRRTVRDLPGARTGAARPRPHARPAGPDHLPGNGRRHRGLPRRDGHRERARRGVQRRRDHWPPPRPAAPGAAPVTGLDQRQP